MGEVQGAKSVDLEGVQVHPTGLVKPDNADAKIKFLAEALRGVRGSPSSEAKQSKPASAGSKATADGDLDGTSKDFAEDVKTLQNCATTA